jgi:hypothetical protein
MMMLTGWLGAPIVPAADAAVWLYDFPHERGVGVYAALCCD